MSEEVLDNKNDDSKPLLRKTQKHEQDCSELHKNSVKVEICPYIKSHLKPLQNSKFLYKEDLEVYQLMYRVYKELDVKPLYFYVRNEKMKKICFIKPWYQLIIKDVKFIQLARRYKNAEGVIQIYYHNKDLNRSVFLDSCFIFAQIFVVCYLIFFVYQWVQQFYE